MKDCVSNCSPKFRLECPIQWSSLRGTSDENVRFCEVCQQEVYYCRTPEEVAQRAIRRHCVAYDSPAPEIEVKADTHRSSSSQAFLKRSRPPRVGPAIDFTLIPGLNDPVQLSPADELALRQALEGLHEPHGPAQQLSRSEGPFRTVVAVNEACRVNGVDPSDYFLAVLNNADAVRADPESWMPWNYRQAQKPTDPPAPT